MKTCNSQPIFKMLNDSFYIYKSHENYWCETYLLNHEIKCNASCTDVRFLLFGDKFVESSETLNRTSPEEYDLRLRVWQKKPNDFISCADNEKSVIENSVLTNNRTEVEDANKTLPSKSNNFDLEKTTPELANYKSFKKQNHRMIISTAPLGESLKCKP